MPAPLEFHELRALATLVRGGRVIIEGRTAIMTLDLTKFDASEVERMSGRAGR